MVVFALYASKSKKISHLCKFTVALCDKKFKIILNNQHCVTIAVETIFFFYGFLIGIHDQIISTKCCYHNNQTAFRQVEISDHTVGNVKVKGWENEKVCPSFCSL